MGKRALGKPGRVSFCGAERVAIMPEEHRRLIRERWQFGPPLQLTIAVKLIEQICEHPLELVGQLRKVLFSNSLRARTRVGEREAGERVRKRGPIDADAEPDAVLSRR